MLNQPRFYAEDVMSQTSTAGTHATAADVAMDMAAFNKLERNAWERELKAVAPAILLQAKEHAKVDAALGEKKTERPRGRPARSASPKDGAISSVVQMRLVGAFLAMD